MNAVAFLLEFLVAIGVLLYALNFIRWLWSAKHILSTVGASVLTLLTSVLSITYLVSKLFF